jgi:GNAT superfamily N-acetyltransferase
MTIRYSTNPPVHNGELNALFEAAWPGHTPRDFFPMLIRSLGYVCAYTEDQLIGFVNVAWDGGKHAFLLDPTVRPDRQRQGIGSELVRQAAELARSKGAEWLHVDYESRLAKFYCRCGFRETAAGLMNLKTTRRSPAPPCSPRQHESKFLSVDLKVRDLQPAEEFDHNLCRRLAGEAELPTKHAVWPAVWPNLDEYLRHETLVAVQNELIVGRAILEARYQPCCELVNLCVRPDCRNQGAGTALVNEAIKRARSMGFKYMFVQENLDDAEAHNIYLKAGFLMATKGNMQRLIRLLDVPVVSNFLTLHPSATFTPEPAAQLGDRWWRLSWREGESSVALYLHGGSCQGDSDGFQPVVQAFDRADGGMSISASAEASEKEMVRGETVSKLTMTVQNQADKPFKGVVRAVLLPDTEVVGEPAAPVPVELVAGESQVVDIQVRVTAGFDRGTTKFLSYRSAPLTLELCWEKGSVLLSVAVKVA